MDISAIRLLTISVLILSNLNLACCVWSLFSDWIARNVPGMSGSGFSTAAKMLANITSPDTLERRVFNETEIQSQFDSIGSGELKEYVNSTIRTSSGVGNMDGFRKMVENTTHFLSKEDAATNSTTFETLFDGSKVSSTVHPLMVVGQADVVRSPLRVKAKLTSLRILFDGSKKSKDITSTPFPTVFIDSNTDLISVNPLQHNVESSSTIPRTIIDESSEFKDNKSTQVPLTYEDGSNYSSSVSTMLYVFEETSTNGYKESEDIVGRLNHSSEVGESSTNPSLFDRTTVSVNIVDGRNDSGSVTSTLDAVEEISTSQSLLNRYAVSEDIELTTRPYSRKVETRTNAIPIFVGDQSNNWTTVSSELTSDAKHVTTIPIFFEANASTIVLDLLGGLTMRYDGLSNGSEQTTISPSDSVLLLDETEVFGEIITTIKYGKYDVSSATDDTQTKFIYEMVDELINNDNGSEFSPTIYNSSTEPVPTVVTESNLRKTMQPEIEDHWLGYFDVIRSNDVKNCLSLLVCETSAEPNLYEEYGRRIHSFFLMYIPREDNRAGWWYKNAAQMGLESNSVEFCKSHFPFCDIDTRHIFTLMEVPKLYK